MVAPSGPPAHESPCRAFPLCQADAIDVAYPPILQSGGTYDPKLSAGSNDDTLSYDVILCQVGTRWVVGMR